MGHDVFLSFRGEDTRTGFISHLYKALTEKHIQTYKDDKSLEIGNFIAPELLEAIETSRFAIVVLSNSFATSKWCLEEISKIVDCNKRGKLTVIPVFYHVSPSDVRHQSNCFEQGFAKHELDPEITPQKVAMWRSAFAEIGAIKGSHVTPDRNESEVVCEILKRIMQDVWGASLVDLTKGLVGIESRVNEVIKILNIESNEVRFIGICGMSGVGKTTLAEVVFEIIRNEFQGSSLIKNIKDIPKDHDSDLCKLQQKLLRELLNDETINVKSTIYGQILLRKMLREKKVLIVLDDMNDEDELKYLAGGHEWFGPGTRIIITTTNSHLLNPCNVNEIFRCEELNCEEALKLFYQSAFREGHPTQGYERLSNDFVKLAGGLPLALNVYGSLLCGHDETYWKGTLMKVQKYPVDKVLGRLEVGYSRLDRYQKDTFMYIACFLKGRDVDLVKDILLDIGLHPVCDIEALRNRFLITTNYDNCVWMHDLLQQMCWKILGEESHGKHIAIKEPKEVVEMLSFKPKGLRRIVIINQEPHKAESDNCIDDPSCFSKMRELKFVRIRNIDFPQGLNYLPNDLRILEWYGCPLKSLPSMFEPKRIFELEMRCSQLETLWEKSLDLPNLRCIDLSFSKDLIKIPDLTSTPNLVKLKLEGCTKLKELHESVVVQKRLCFISLNGCTHLQSLGKGIMEMDALVTLLLSGCSNLEYIPEFGRNMKCLEYLYVDGTKIKKLPESLGELCSLRYLDASETCIQQIPLSIHCLKKLRLVRAHRCPLSSQSRGFLFTKMDMLLSGLKELDLSYCNLAVVPDGIGLLHQLIELDLSGNDFVFLPANISLLSNLQMLNLNNCKRLQSLPKLSLVNEDTLYGLPIRFNYIISKHKVDVTNFHATSNSSGPLVSCLNCPKVAEKESSCHLAERILNSYLQLRTKYWITPEAVFEIVGAGSEIPSRYKLPTFHENIILEGPWIGVVICAVVAVHQIDAAVESKHVVTAHIHDGEQLWRIPAHINFLASGLVNQLVFYWTRADDLPRTTLDFSQRINLKFSFSVEPQDCRLQVTKFGVHFIRQNYMMQLKTLEANTNLEVEDLDRDTLSLFFLAVNCLHSCDSITNDLTWRILKFIGDYGKGQNTLDDMCEVIKCVIEINQEALRECKEEWSHRELFPLVYDYYRICQGTYKLHSDFLRLLKDVADHWLSVKLALGQMVTKSKAEVYSCKEIQIMCNDLEGAEGIRFSDHFIKSFACICEQTAAFLRRLSKEIQNNKKLKSVTLMKASRIMIGGVFGLLAVYTGNIRLFRQLKAAAGSGWFECSAISGSGTQSYGRELCILEFFDCAAVVKELNIKLDRFGSFTQFEEEMLIVNDKLEEKMNNFSKAIDDMRRHADIYSLDIREAGLTLSRFIADSNLQAPSDREAGLTLSNELNENPPLNEEISILYQAALSVRIDSLWYIRAYEAAADSSLPLSCDSVIHDNTNSIIKIIYGWGHSLDGIHEVVKSLNAINQEAFMVLSECKEEWRVPKLFPLVNDYHKICLGASQLYIDFIRLLKGHCERWSPPMLELKKNIEVNDPNKQDREVCYIDNGGVLMLTHDFIKAIANICKQTLAFTRHFDEEIQDLKSVKILARGSCGLIAGVFSVMAHCIADKMAHCIADKMAPKRMPETLNDVWLHLNQSFSWKSPSWMDQGFAIAEFSEITSLHRKLQCSEVRIRCITTSMDDLEKMINKLSVTIEDMTRHAHKYSHDIKEAGTTLGLTSLNHMGVKRKRTLDNIN